MGGRDHFCEGSGRGGFNDPDGRCECMSITVTFEDPAAYDLFAGGQLPKAEIVGGPQDGLELTYSPTESSES